MSGDRIVRRLLVSGKVQGVWFRAWTVGEAQALGLDGWVRNRAGGSVEILAAGPAAAVADLIARCHRGSPASQVASVQVNEEDGPVDPGFRQAPTV
ncbi:MAG: acylphosphatase [Rhizorhabdus sp.]|nr:acylphosphatase [Rhizorhabdus sp.]